MPETPTTKSFLEENPRMIGVAFGLLLLLTQIQPALGGIYTVHGP